MNNATNQGVFSQGHWAVILGGSSGFGLATARKLTAHGMNLFLVHRDRRATQRRVEPEFEAMRSLGVQLVTHNADALSAERREELVADLTRVLEGGKVRVLLHSIAFGNLKLIAPEQPRAGLGKDGRAALAKELGIDPEKLGEVTDRLFESGVDELEGLATKPKYGGVLDAEDMARTIYSMGTSLLDWTQDLLSRGLFCEDARVFGLTSEGNTVAWKGYAAVAAAKVSLESVSRAIAMECAPYGLRCNVIQAGVTETPALAAIPGSTQIKAGARRRNPFGRLTTPQDVANVIYLLSLEEAGWINGEVIRVDGGEHISGSNA
jgi:NAD(P)-dependent dehydrogenase (short-subunit alcohol dehydrogenase family)